MQNLDWRLHAGRFARVHASGRGCAAAHASKSAAPKVHSLVKHSPSQLQYAIVAKLWFSSLCMLGGVALLLSLPGVPPRSVSFSQFTADLDAYNFVELTAQVLHLYAPTSRRGCDYSWTL
jgi:hypothetical protein